METCFSAHVEPETGFGALMATDRRVSALAETEFSALVETETCFCFLVEAETCFSVHLLLHFRFLEVRLMLTSADGARGGSGGLPAAAGAMLYQRPHVLLPRWAGCVAAAMH